jgi:hypothetical protein
MFLREEDLTLAAVGRAPLPDAALERPKRGRPIFTWPAPLQFLQQRHGIELRIGLQERQEFGLPDLRKRIRTRSPLPLRALRWERF